MKFVRQVFTAVAMFLYLLSGVSPASAAHFYVDRKFGSVAERATMTPTGPVQILVGFQTNGVRNEKATKQATKR